MSLDDPQAATALNLILGGTRSDSAPVIADRLAEFHADCTRRQLRIDLLFATYQGAHVEGACAALVSPGSAALVLVPPPAPTLRSRAALGKALAAARKASASRELVLLQLLQAPEDGELTSCLHNAGFTNITTLFYMQRDPRLNTQPRAETRTLRLVTFDSALERRFCETLARTYDGSLDCPELSGLRPPVDILASHRSAGDFDPHLWWLALRGDEAVGVLLLAPLRSGEILEIVYLGVVRSARGTGVAGCLLNYAIHEARHRSAQTLALAVDRRNLPALQLYASWGFSQIGERVAWIATNAPTEACARQRDAKGAPHT